MTDHPNRSAATEDDFEALREVEEAWLASELSRAIANLAYPVGCGTAPTDYHMKAAAKALFDRYAKMIKMARGMNTDAQAVPVAWRWRTSPAHYWALTEIYPGDDVTDVQPLYASQPSPAATVETKPFSAKENLREVVAQVQADIEAAQLRCSAVSVELKQCPFCGKPPVMIASTEDDSFVRCYEIRCDQCGIEVSEEYKSETIARWNTRTGDEPQGVPVTADTVPFTDPQTATDTRLILADEYEAGLRKMEASGYEDWQKPIQNHKMVIEALRFQARSSAPPQAVATPAFDALAAEVIDRISERYNKLAASPLGMATAWERKASGGKPLLYGGKRGLLASGTIATWDEFDLIADVINNLPTLLAACSVSRPQRPSESALDASIPAQQPRE